MKDSLNANLLSKEVSVVNEADLLKQIVQFPEKIDEADRQKLFHALASQGNLAAFANAKLAIIGMSLNTHKAIANNILDGGYGRLNEYRKTALKSLKMHRAFQEKPKRRTIEWYQEELTKKNRDLNFIIDEISLMSLKLDEVLNLALDMAMASGRTEEFKKRQLEIFRKYR
jgi:hypothetical protein